MIGIVVTFVSLGLGAYFLRLFVDYLTKRYADRMARKITEEIKKDLTGEILKQAEKDVQEYLSRSEETIQEIKDLIEKSKNGK